MKRLGYQASEDGLTEWRSNGGVIERRHLYAADSEGWEEVAFPCPDSPEALARFCAGGGFDYLPPVFSKYLLDEPAGENRQFPFGLSYGEGDNVDDEAVEALAAKFGLEVEWAGSPEEYEDGSGVWSFRVILP